MATALGRIGPLGAFWRKHLDVPLTAVADGSVVVDCRSSSYAVAWTPRETPWVAVKVLRDLDGKRSVVSHMAKHTRGLLTAHLLSFETAPDSAQDVADAAAGLLGVSLVDVSLEARTKGPDELTVVVAG